MPQGRSRAVGRNCPSQGQEKSGVGFVLGWEGSSVPVLLRKQRKFRIFLPSPSAADCDGIKRDCL